MLAVFSGEVVEVPAELVAAGSRTPSPKTKASQLVGRFLAASEPAVSVQLGDHGHLAYSHTNQALLRPRYVRSCTGLHTALLLAGQAGISSILHAHCLPLPSYEYYYYCYLSDLCWISRAQASRLRSSTSSSSRKDSTVPFHPSNFWKK